MDLSAVVARVQSTSAFRLVGGAMEFSAAQDAAPPPPCAYVLPLADRGERNGLLGAISQRVTRRLGVLIGVKNVRDAGGLAAATDLATLRTTLFGTLLGWQPPEAESPLEFRDGRLMSFADGVLWWQDDFEYECYLRA